MKRKSSLPGVFSTILTTAIVVGLAVVGIQAVGAPQGTTQGCENDGVQQTKFGDDVAGPFVDVRTCPKLSRYDMDRIAFEAARRAEQNSFCDDDNRDERFRPSKPFLKLRKLWRCGPREQ